MQKEIRLNFILLQFYLLLKYANRIVDTPVSPSVCWLSGVNFGQNMAVIPVLFITVFIIFF